MNKQTTPEDFAAQMRKIRDEQGGDLEISHSEMDDLMARVLVELGYGEGVDIFNGQDKWYA